MKREDVILRFKEQQALMDHYHIASLFLFGSVARNEARPDSDIDLLIEFREPIGLFEFVELKDKLESLLGCPVDLGTKRSLKLRLKDRVLQEAVRVA